MKVSGLDVHKDSIFCAIYDGKFYSEVKYYDSATNSIRNLGSQLQGKDVLIESDHHFGIQWEDIDTFPTLRKK